jgi:hypothetical protein
VRIKAQVFADFPFFAFSKERLDQARRAILNESPDYLLNVNETEYLQHLESRFRLDPIVFDLAQMTMETEEQLIPANRFPPMFSVTAGRSYPKQAYIFHIPFTGTFDLLRCTPSQSYVGVIFLCEARTDEILFEVVDIYGDGNRVKQEQEQMTKSLESTAHWLAADVQKYNQSLSTCLHQEFSNRKAEILKQRSIAASIGVRIRPKSQVPSTFAVPASIKAKISPKPTASAASFVPEPTIDESVYRQILQVIQDTGRVFERLPSVSSGKDEEALRDYLILQLEPRFEGSTTGETFNKQGKTDILMRHEGKNIFVAECKFWRGPKAHLEAIDQLLGYLTWRDSKTALICFVDNKEMVSVLNAIRECTSQHECFVSFKNMQEESWFNFEFHLPGDHGRRVFLAILAFHLPKT